MAACGMKLGTLKSRKLIAKSMYSQNLILHLENNTYTIQLYNSIENALGHRFSSTI